MTEKNEAQKKEVNIKFNNVRSLINMTIESGSTEVPLTRGSGVRSLHLPDLAAFSQAHRTIAQLFALNSGAGASVLV